MHIDTAGTYTLQYTATDSCGNETIEEREVIVAAPRTVLYTDGTFIINEKPEDMAGNIALHGAATNVYDPFDPNGSTSVKKYVFSSASQRPWSSQAGNVKSVEIGEDIVPIQMSEWFYNFSACTSMNLSRIDTSNVNYMKNLFSGCKVLPSLDVSNFDTSKVTTMERMFFDCRALASLDVTGFDTQLVTNMSKMFQDCRALTSLDVTNFDTKAVINMSYMFAGCQALRTLDITQFNTSVVTDMSYMFQNCRVLTALDTSNFNTNRVTTMFYMFSGCRALTSLDVSSFNTSAVTTMGQMFSSCQALTSLDVSSFNTSAVTNMVSMFESCQRLATIYASNDFVVAQVTASGSMFGSMSTNLVGGAGTTWASGNPTDKTYAHIDGGTADPGYFTAKP